MLYPYGRSRAPRDRSVIDRWAGPGWRLLERHALRVRATPVAAFDAVASTTLAELPAVRALFALRGLRFSSTMTLRSFFSTPPFVWLEEEPGREGVFGVLIPPPGPGGRRRPSSPTEFRTALAGAPFAAIGTFCAEPDAEGVTLWTETWSRTRGAVPSLIFGGYWLAIGPWSAWIRRMFLRAAKRRAERVRRRVDGDLNDAIVLYIGFGVASSPRQDRSLLSGEFGEERAKALELEVQALLAELGSIAVNWETHDLVSGAALVRAAMQTRHPELSGRALDAIEWKFSHDWK